MAEKGEITLLVFLYIFSFVMSYTVGANDAANSLATSYGSGAAPLYVLLVGGAICEWVGAFWGSG